MAHEIDMSNGKANMAYVGKTPWHELGQQIDPNATIEEWRKAAGLDWSILRTPVLYQAETGLRQASIGRDVLYRSDTGDALSVVSDSYKEVQPEAILGFFNDLTKGAGFTMHTAGSLRGGQKIWALAEIGKEAKIASQDKVQGYLLLATACDGRMATTARFTSVRVVCMNTLTLALGSNVKDGQQVKVCHFDTFDPEKVKDQLGITVDTWSAFIESAKLIAKIKLDDRKATQILQRVYAATDDDRAMEPEKFLDKSQTVGKVIDLWHGKAIGSDLESARGTAWGLVNAVTEFYDHHSKSRSADTRLDSSWFGKSAQTKEAVFAECVKLAA